MRGTVERRSLVLSMVDACVGTIRAHRYAGSALGDSDFSWIHKQVRSTPTQPVGPAAESSPSFTIFGVVFEAKGE